MSSNFTSQEFSKQIQLYIGEFQARGESRMYYKLPRKPEEWLKHLFKVDEPYYRYINQMDEAFIPTFNHHTVCRWESNGEENGDTTTV